MNSITTMLGPLYCDGWIPCTVAHAIGQVFLLSSAFLQFELRVGRFRNNPAGNQIYMTLFACAIVLTYALYFYTMEYALRFGALKYVHLTNVRPQ
jgi:hypothetical protein